MAFKKAIKRDAKLRLALCGAAGSGKTFTLLRLATSLGGPIAYIDTEHGSASKYAHTDKCGGPGVCEDPSHFEFDVDEPQTFDPRDLIDAINNAVEGGYRCICIDSLSHYWMGVGGELELVDNAAKGTKGNSFAAWKAVTPLHTALVDKLISAQIHVLVSMRTKTEWVIEDNDRGKKQPRKIGMQPIMRDGIEFEFDVCGDMDQDNNLVVTKTRCSALSGKVINRPGPDMASILREWLAGAPAEVFVPTAAPALLQPKREIPEELLAVFEGMAKNPKDRSHFNMALDSYRDRLDAVGGHAEAERLVAEFDAIPAKTAAMAKGLLLDLHSALTESESKIGATT